jgi:carbonic anhydrase
MSVYSQSVMKEGACSTSNQSPINLSQTFAKPCDVLCDLVFDEAYATNAVVGRSMAGLVLSSQTSLGTCKYNGAGYTCNFLVVSHPSHHTIEDIQADAEVVAVFKNPTGKTLIICSLVRVNPTQTESIRFLSSFIPYATPSAGNTPIVLNNWSLSMMVPPNATFYSYQGSLPFPGCNSAQVIVFSSMINIDANDFALLVKDTPAGSRSVQPLGNRDVFFNGGQQLPGGNMPNDGKFYMRIHKKSDSKDKTLRPVKKPDIQTPQAVHQSKTSTLGAITKWAGDQVAINGWFSIVNLILLALVYGGALYCAYMYNYQLSSLLVLNDKGKMYGISFGQWIRSFFGGSSSYTPLERGVASRKLV